MNELHSGTADKMQINFGGHDKYFSVVVGSRVCATNERTMSITAYYEFGVFTWDDQKWWKFTQSDTTDAFDFNFASYILFETIWWMYSALDSLCFHCGIFMADVMNTLVKICFQLNNRELESANSVNSVLFFRQFKMQNRYFHILTC